MSTRICGLAASRLTRHSGGVDDGGLTWFNELPGRAAQQALLECCSAPRWAVLMAAARPYASAGDAVRQSSAIVAALTIPELAEALAGHPRIGERPEASDEPRAAHSSVREQSSIDTDDAGMMRALAESNLEYEQRFGHIYLVCASGRTGSELLAALRARLRNEPEDEWNVVRTELQKVNALRLQRLMAGMR